PRPGVAAVPGHLDGCRLRRRQPLSAHALRPDARAPVRRIRPGLGPGLAAGRGTPGPGRPGRRPMTMAAHPVSARVRVWLGWTLAVATIALCGAGTNFGDAAARAHAHVPAQLRATQQYFNLTPIFAISFAIVGALIVWRRPRNRIGWVCCGVGILWGFGHNGYVVFNPVGGTAIPLGLAGLA